MFPFRLPWATTSRASRTVPQELSFSESIQPVVNVGTPNEDGLVFQPFKAERDRAFTLSNENEAIAAGASMFVDPLRYAKYMIY